MKKKKENKKELLDDVYIASSPLWVGHSFAVLQEQLLRHSNIRVHLGKIKVEFQWSADKGM